MARGPSTRNGEGSEENTPAMAETVQAVLQAIAAAAVPPPPPPVDELAELINRFSRLSPPIFKGTTNPLAAESWLKDMEWVFTLMTCTEIQKVSCASYALRDSARLWWEMTSRANNTAENPLAWTEFKELFRSKYVPIAVRRAKEAEFISLKQGNMTLQEYEAKFEELSHYGAKYVDTAEEKARRFEAGLRTELYNAVVVLRLPTYEEVLQRVQLIVERNPPRREVSSSSEKRHGHDNNSHDSNNNNNKNNKRRFEGRDSGEDKRPRQSNDWVDIQTCATCGKKHGGECYKKIGACFRCGKVGHLMRDCRATQAEVEQVRARVYSMTRTVADGEPSVGAGKLLFSNLWYLFCVFLTLHILWYLVVY